jgi:hypothetical protein
VNQLNGNLVEIQAVSEKPQKKFGVFVQFASLACLTQGVLLLNQIVLLPIQIRVWGTESAAYWYSTLAIAAVTSVGDFGLRTAGHAELIRYAHNHNDLQAKTEFQHFWAWIRILVLSTTASLIAMDFIHKNFYMGASYPLWRPALLIGIALEALLCIRIMYLDSQGLYREGEAGYLVLASSRLFLALCALLIFHAPPSTVAWIWFFTGVYAIARQSRLCRRLGLLLLFERIPPGLSFKTLATVRHTLADPCSTWARINGPVVILSIIAQPIAIITYVALRAVFGAARTTVLQLSRYASVEYLSLRQSRKFKMAEIHLTLCVLAGAFFASAVTAFVIADNGRLLSLLIRKLDVLSYKEIAITFGLGSAFYCYQLLQAVSRRSGEVVRVAHRQYFYICCAAVFAVIAVATKSTLLWLALMLVADILVSLSFMLKAPQGGILAQTSAGWRGCLAATASTVIILTMWLIVHFANFDFLRAWTASAFASTMAFWLLWISLIGAVDLCLVYALPGNISLVGALRDWLHRIRNTKLQNE